MFTNHCCKTRRRCVRPPLLAACCLLLVACCLLLAACCLLLAACCLLLAACCLLLVACCLLLAAAAASFTSVFVRLNFAHMVAACAYIHIKTLVLGNIVAAVEALEESLLEQGSLLLLMMMMMMMTSASHSAFAILPLI